MEAVTSHIVLPENPLYILMISMQGLSISARQKRFGTFSLVRLPTVPDRAINIPFPIMATLLELAENGRMLKEIINHFFIPGPHLRRKRIEIEGQLADHFLFHVITPE
ncbi:MAG TPA: hypothetical protein VGK14_05495 [Novimethylophilus sp.]|jgi:hypothetical protein|uniref:hypothetical protein n=1 Tax=Novimethylophilus sp. TaxID=2137426 RepID=UPI002F3F8362